MLRIFLRPLIFLLVALWVGALLFFPVVAAVSFGHLADRHAAGTVTRLCLRVLHGEGLAAGATLIVLLLAAGRLGAYGRGTNWPTAMVAAMLLATAYSQYSIMPRMERDRLAVGGAIDAAPNNDPRQAEFNQLHRLSEGVESFVLMAGLTLIALLARPPIEAEPPNDRHPVG